MPEHPLYVAIVWHMHQPFYRNMRSGEITLPWVRLHAAKDYLHMAEVLAAYPSVQLTINVVPSLADQILAWAQGRDQDRLAQLAERTHWSPDEKRFILDLCFSVSSDNIIRRYLHYAELLQRRPEAVADPESFSEGDYRDLLAWFNLAWIDPNWLENDLQLRALVDKGRDFTLSDLATIHAKQREIASKVLPLYRQLSDRGQLELATSPFYHPILPLLLDTAVARRASPGLPLPAMSLEASDDAAAQLNLAVTSHSKHFGQPPRGLWPPEGAVSHEMLSLVVKAGFRWIASDEVVLGNSLGRPFERDGNAMVTNPRALYQHYHALAGSELGPSTIFRDHELSDRIGFLYQRLPGEQAAEDLTYRLLEIRNRINDPANPYLVTIILDGENCWEYYDHNGDVFLHAFYKQLTSRRELRAVTVSQYLAQHRAGGTLARLATGSWIAGDLTTWIGDNAHNRAWEALVYTRSQLAQATAQSPEHPGLGHAWQALYAAEGSDWFWWYSHRNRSDQNPLFDRLFRDDLAATFEALGRAVPAWLEAPISPTPAGSSTQMRAGFITPQLAGESFPGDEWALAATAQPASTSTGTMQRADALIGRLLVGHDRRSLYLRLDLRDRLDKYGVAIYLTGTNTPLNQRPRHRAGEDVPAPGHLALGWAVELQAGQQVPFLFQSAGQEQWGAVGPVAAGVGDKVVEAALPLDVLGLEVNGQVSLYVTVLLRDVVVAQLPESEMMTVELVGAPLP